MRNRFLLSSLLIIILLVSACSTGRGAAPPPAQTSQPASPGPLGGQLIRLWDDPPTLDPHLTSDVSAATLVVEIFGGLVTLNSKLEPVPDLAEGWKTSDDGKTYTFKLRPDAKFQSGKPVTAQDFKWSFERAADPKTLSTTADTYLGDIVGIREKHQGKAREVSGVKVIDDHTLQITIDSPKSYFISKLTYPTAFVLDKDNVGTGREWFKTPNGTGPFKLTEYAPGDHLILSRNLNYHLGVARLDSIKFLLAGGTAMVMYENNEIQITGVGLADLDRVKDPKSPLSKELHISPPGFDTSYLGMNVNMPPFDDIKVRQALTLAINKEDIATKVLASRVTPAYGILPPGFPAYNSGLKGLKYDPVKAKQLLSESKYGSDLSKMPRITLTVPGEMGTSVGLDLEAIMASWRDTLGITVDVQQVEWATFLKDLNAFRLQLYAAAWSADYPDPQDFLDLLFHSQSLNNQTLYSNPAVDKLLEQARTERDEKTRFGLYQQAEQMIVNDAAWIPLWYPGEGYVLVKPEVKDYFLLPIIVPKYRFIYIDKPKV